MGCAPFSRPMPAHDNTGAVDRQGVRIQNTTRFSGMKTNVLSLVSKRSKSIIEDQKFADVARQFFNPGTRARLDCCALEPCGWQKQEGAAREMIFNATPDRRTSESTMSSESETGDYVKDPDSIVQHRLRYVALIRHHIHL